MEKYIKLHIAAFVVHFAQAIALIAIAIHNDDGSKKGKWPISLTRFSEVKSTIDVYIAYFTAVPSTLSAINHLLCGVLCASTYRACVQRHYDPYRWTEYSVSAGVMLVLISNLSGISDAYTLFLLFGGNVIMQLCGLLSEYIIAVTRYGYGGIPDSAVDDGAIESKNNHMQSVARWLVYIAWGIFVLTWAIVVWSYSEALLDAKKTENIPDAVWAIVPSMFSLFSLFGFTFYVSFKKSTINYEDVVLTFIVLSIVAKSLLNWLIVGGALRERNI